MLHSNERHCANSGREFNRYHYSHEGDETSETIPLLGQSASGEVKNGRYPKTTRKKCGHAAKDNSALAIWIEM